MEEVLGLGSVALAARNPAALATWYADCLGLHMAASAEGTLVLVPDGLSERQALRTLALASAPPAGGTFGLTLRVRALDAIVRQIQRQGTDVEIDGDIHSHGAFARFRDPEGNQIVLWEAIVGDARE